MFTKADLLIGIGITVFLTTTFAWIIFESVKNSDYEDKCNEKGGVVISQWSTDACIKAEFLLPRNEMF